MAFDLASAEEVQSPGFDIGSAQPAMRPQIQRAGEGPWDAWVAGWKGSGTGLFKRGKLPDIVLDPRHAKWYENALATVGSTASGLPESIGAAWVVKGGGPRAMWAAANAVPTEIREALTRAYESG